MKNYRALPSSNDMRMNQYSPSEDLIAVFSRTNSSIPICEYPLFSSSVEKFAAFSGKGDHFSIRGILYESRFVTVFCFQYCIRIGDYCLSWERLELAASLPPVRVRISADPENCLFFLFEIPSCKGLLSRAPSGQVWCGCSVARFLAWLQ